MTFIIIIVCTFFGFLGGLGVGGGSLLMLVLSQLLPYPQARVLNLLFFLPCAMISTLLRKRRGSLQTKGMLLPALAGVTAAFIFSLLGKNLDTSLLKKGFGILLLITGLRELTAKY